MRRFLRFSAREVAGDKNTDEDKGKKQFQNGFSALLALDCHF
jgi:hypothetical protein